MGESKPFASLTSGLLARKGAARPAMRPQGFASFDPGAPAGDALGWNDLGAGDESERPAGARLPASLAGAPALPEVIRQQDEIAREFAVTVDPATIPAPRAGGRKAAFTLRLDADRHRRLRLACAVENRSAQQIVAAALDAALDRMPEVERLARRLADDAAKD